MSMKKFDEWWNTWFSSPLANFPYSIASVKDWCNRAFNAGHDQEKVYSEALKECLDFMVVEMGWEDFRMDRLYQDDDPRQQISGENRRKLKNFLAQPRIKELLQEFHL